MRNIRKKGNLIIITVVFSLLFSMNVMAAPKTMANGLIFDTEYYAKKNPDVVTALGSEEKVLFNHYMNYGNKEGRLAYEGDKGQVIPITFMAGSGTLKLANIIYTRDGKTTVFPADVKYMDMMNTLGEIWSNSVTATWTNGTTTITPYCHWMVSNYDYKTGINGAYYCSELIAFQQIGDGSIIFLNSNKKSVTVYYPNLDGYQQMPSSYSRKNLGDWLGGSEDNWIYF